MILRDAYATNALFVTCNSFTWMWAYDYDSKSKGEARDRVYDARAEIAAVNEAMSAPNITWMKWRGAPRYNACIEPCDNWNGPCVCGAWHKDGK